MEEQQKNIDDLFRQSLGDYREAPPAAAWEKVAAQLDADKTESPKKYYFLRWLWFSLALLVLVGGGWFIAAHQAHKETITNQHSLQENKNQKSFLENTEASTDTAISARDAMNQSTTETSVVQKSNQASNKRTANSKSHYDVDPSEKASKTGSSKDADRGNKDRNASNPSKRGEETEGAHSKTNKATAANSSSSRNASSGKAKTDEKDAKDVADNSSALPTTSSKKRIKSALAKTDESQSVKGFQGKSVAKENSLADKARRNAERTAPAASSKSYSGKQAEVVVENASAKEVAQKTISNEEQQVIAPKASRKKSRQDSDKKLLAKTSKVVPPKETAKTVKGQIASTPKSSANTKPAETASQKLPPLVQQTEFKWQPMAKAAPAITNEEEDAPELDNKDEEVQAPVTLATGSGTGGGGAGSGVEEKKTNHKPKSFSVTAMAGYEFPTKKSGVNQITGGLRLLWHFDAGIALGIQPMFRFGNMSTRSVGDPTAYQQSSYQVDSVIRFDSTGMVDYRQYNISQKFDSISVAGAAISGTMWQLELPIILSYNIAKAWRLYLGASLNFGGKLNSTSGAVSHFESFSADSLKGVGGAVIPARSASSFATYFGESSLPQFNSYTPAATAVEKPASLRFGYLFGVGYDAKRFTFDASIHQQVSGYDKLPKSVQEVFSTAAIRLSFGYYLVPPRNKRVSIEP